MTVILRKEVTRPAEIMLLASSGYRNLLEAPSDYGSPQPPLLVRFSNYCLSLGGAPQHIFGSGSLKGKL